MNLLVRICLLLWAFYIPCVWAEETATELSPEDQFRQAVTWYKVARATENSMEAHERAAKLYKSVIENTDDTTLKLAAERGLDQTIFRIDNAHDTYRTLFDPVWWITGEDGTIEWYDDPYMLAVGNAWNAVEAHLSRELDPENHVAVVYVTRNPDLQRSLLDEGAENFEDNRDYRLKLIRDEIIGMAEATPSLTGMPDDLMPIVKPWIDKPNITSEDVEIIASKLNTQGIVLLHANIDDEIEPTDEYLGVVRMSLSTQFWKVGDDAPYATIKSIGIGQDATTHQGVAAKWLFVMALLSIATALAAIIFNDGRLSFRSKKGSLQVGRVVFTALMAFAVGCVWANLSFAFASDYQVDWGQASLIRDYDSFQIPYLPSMRWAWVLGLVSLSGPALVLAWAFSRLDSIIYTLLPTKELQFPVLLPSMAVGILAFLFMPLVMAHTSGGLYVATTLTLSSVLAIWVLSPFIGQLFQGMGNTSKLTMWVVCFLIGLSLVLPFGLFNDWHWGVSVILLLSCAVTQWINFDGQEILDDEEAQPFEFVDVENPFVNLPLIQAHQELLESITDTLEDHSICVTNPKSIGQSPLFKRLHVRLLDTNEEAQPTKVVYLHCGENDSEPFAFVQRLFSKVGVHTNIIPSEDTGGNLITDSVDSIVTALPGVEFMMGLLGDATMGLSRQVIVNDLIEFLGVVVKRHTSIVLLIEEAHYIDDASLEVLQAVLIEEPALKVVWEVGTIDDLHLQFTSQSKNVEIPPVSFSELQEFLCEFGLIDMPEELLHEILEITQRDFSQIIGVLIYLYDEQHLQKDVEGHIRFTKDLKTTPIHQIVPNDFERIELERFQQLTTQEQLILECASVCGVTFYAEEISHALEMSHIAVLSSLEHIERKMTPPMVFDVPEQNGVYQFHSRLTQSVISKRLVYEHSTLPKEFAVRFHKQIVHLADVNNTEIPLHRLVQHAGRVRHLNTPNYLRLLSMYIDSLVHSFAWPEVVEVFLENSSIFDRMEVSDRLQCSIAYARAVRYHPNPKYFESMQPQVYQRLQISDGDPTSNVHASMQWMTMVLETALLEEESLLFKVVQEWCVLGFVPREEGQLPRFVQYATEVLKYISGVPKYYLESFVHSANSRSMNVTPLLSDLVDALRAVEDSPQQQFALGSILKEYAGQHLFHATQGLSFEEKSIFWYNDIVPLYAEANQLMRTQQDWSGLAVSYGVQANMYLFTLQEFDKALDLLRQDLDLIERYHFVEYESSVYGRISLAYQGMLQQELSKDTPSATVAEDLFDLARSSAQKAFDVATRLHNDRDAGMAKSSVDKLENDFKSRVYSMEA